MWAPSITFVLMALIYYFVWLSGSKSKSKLARKWKRKSPPRPVKRQPIRSTEPLDAPEVQIDEVRPVCQGGRMVTVQNTWSNKRPTLEPFIEDIEVPDGVVDLRGLDHRRLRITGMTAEFSDTPVTAWSFLLCREPSEIHLGDLITVRLVDGSLVGYLSAAATKSYAPLLDKLGSKFLVTGVGSAGTTSNRMWVDLPRVPVLRKFVKSSQK